MLGAAPSGAGRPFLGIELISDGVATLGFVAFGQNRLTDRFPRPGFGAGVPLFLPVTGRRLTDIKREWIAGMILGVGTDLANIDRIAAVLA